jgi:hypothetical protein
VPDAGHGLGAPRRRATPACARRAGSFARKRPRLSAARPRRDRRCRRDRSFRRRSTVQSMDSSSIWRSGAFVLMTGCDRWKLMFPARPDYSYDGLHGNAERVQSRQRDSSAPDYLSLRSRAGLSPKTAQQGEAALRGSWCAVHAVASDGVTVGMGRVIGDGGWYSTSRRQSCRSISAGVWGRHSDFTDRANPSGGPARAIHNAARRRTRAPAVRSTRLRAYGA